MPTNKPKIAGYLNQDLFDKFKAFASENSFSDSQAIAFILEEYFGGSPMNQGELPSSTSRLDALEDEVKLLREMYSPIYDKLFRGESQGEPQGSILDDIVNLDGSSPDELPGELPQIINESPSDLPSEPLTIINESPDELPGELPQIINESPSDLPSEPLTIINELPSKLPGGLPPNKDIVWMSRKGIKRKDAIDLLSIFPDREEAFKYFLNKAKS